MEWQLYAQIPPAQHSNSVRPVLLRTRDQLDELGVSGELAGRISRALAPYFASPIEPGVRLFVSRVQDTNTAAADSWRFFIVSPGESERQGEAQTTSDLELYVYGGA